MAEPCWITVRPYYDSIRAKYRRSATCWAWMCRCGATSGPEAWDTAIEAFHAGERSEGVRSHVA